MGARKVVVASMGPIGCIPFQLTLRLSRNGECSEKVNADARLFNAGILAMVKQLNAELPGAHFLYADAYKGVMDMISNPSQYGKTSTLERSLLVSSSYCNKFCYKFLMMIRFVFISMMMLMSGPIV